MGVEGLQGFVERSDIGVILDLQLEGRYVATNRASNEIVLDGSGLLRRLYKGHLDWVRGGQFEAFRDFTAEFVNLLKDCGFTVTVIFDGAVEQAKRRVWLSRRRQEAKLVQRIFQHIVDQNDAGECEPPPRSLWLTPISATWALRKAFSYAGVKVLTSVGEADREIAEYCITNNCYGVLGLDSDFVIFNIPRYLLLNTLVLKRSKKPTVMCVERTRLLEGLSLKANHMPVLASLVGNDFVPRPKLAAFHRMLLGKPYYSKNEPLPPTKDIVPLVIQYLSDKPDDLELVIENEPLLRGSLVDYIRQSVKQYSLTHIPESISMKHVPSPLQEPKIWNQILHKHRNSMIYHHTLSILSTRLINLGVVIENPKSVPSWKVCSDLMRRIYGIVLGDQNKASLNSTLGSNSSSPEKITASTASASANSPQSGAFPSTPDNAALPDSPLRSIDGDSIIVEDEIGEDSLVDEVLEEHDDDGGDFDVDGAPLEEDELELFDDDDEEEYHFDDQIDEMVVREWVWYYGKEIGTPDIGQPIYEFNGRPLPSYASVLQMTQRQQLQTFLFMMDCKDINFYSLIKIYNMPEVMVLVCAALRYIANHPEMHNLQLFELDALLAQALWQSMKPPGRRPLTHTRAQSIDPNAIHIGSVFLRVMFTTCFLNEVCCSPLQVQGPWQYYDGIVFHRFYFHAKTNARMQRFCGRDPQVQKLFLILRKLIVKNTRHGIFVSNGSFQQSSIQKPLQMDKASPSRYQQSPGRINRTPPVSGKKFPSPQSSYTPPKYQQSPRQAMESPGDRYRESAPSFKRTPPVSKQGSSPVARFTSSPPQKNIHSHYQPRKPSSPHASKSYPYTPDAQKGRHVEERDKKQDVDPSTVDPAIVVSVRSVSSTTHSLPATTAAHSSDTRKGEYAPSGDQYQSLPIQSQPLSMYATSATSSSTAVHSDASLLSSQYTWHSDASQWDNAAVMDQHEPLVGFCSRCGQSNHPTDECPGLQSSSNGQSNAPCAFFARGYCKRGAKCWYRHDTTEASYVYGYPQQQQQYVDDSLLQHLQQLTLYGHYYPQ
jgi:hypothetical protein